MKPISRKLLRYAGALVIIAAASLIADVFSRVTGTSRLTSIFLSSVLLAALYLGTGPGYFAAAVALLAHLYLVDPPYRFSLGSVDELNALLLFMAASILTCLLAGRVREERQAARFRSQINSTLLQSVRELSETADEALIRERLVARLCDLAGGPALARDGLRHDASPSGSVTAEDLRQAAHAERAVREGRLAPISNRGWSFRPLAAGGQVFGVAGWRSGPNRSVRAEETAALELLTDTGGAAIARARLAAAKAEAEARARTEDLRNALLSSISHDLRTPLATIMGAASSLRRFDEQFDHDTRDDLAATIEEESARLDAFVSNLLQMSRLQSGTVALKRTAFNLSEVVSHTLERRLKGRRPEVRVISEAGLPEALGDPALFEQALGNIVENAVRYAPGPVEIAISRVQDGLKLSVKDRGPGVPPEDLDRIFEKFFRSASSGRIGGTGLGLAIARGLLEGMHGSVSAQLRYGGGLVVDMYLPTAS